MIHKSIRATAVLIARTYLEKKGSVEIPDGSNQGFWIDRFKQRFGGGKDWAWCMYYVQGTLAESYDIFEPILGMENPFDLMPMSKRGHCMSVWRFAMGCQLLHIIPASAILAGEKIPLNSIFIIGRADDTGHTGWVVSHWQDDNNHQGDIIRTLEGNKSNRVDTGKYTLAELMNKGLKGIVY